MITPQASTDPSHQIISSHSHLFTNIQLQTCQLLLAAGQAKLFEQWDPVGVNDQSKVDFLDQIYNINTKCNLIDYSHRTRKLIAEFYHRRNTFSPFRRPDDVDTFPNHPFANPDSHDALPDFTCHPPSSPLYSRISLSHNSNWLNESYLPQQTTQTSATSAPHSSLIPPLSNHEPPLSSPILPVEENLLLLEELGLNHIDKIAFVLVAGGVGERLGYEETKLSIPFNLLTNWSILEYYCEFIYSLEERINEKYKNIPNQKCIGLPLVIMTSDDTHEQTIKLLEQNHYFKLQPYQITVLKQQQVPAVLDSHANFNIIKTPITQKEHSRDDIPTPLLPQPPNTHLNPPIHNSRTHKYTLETKPHGHGDIHYLLHHDKDSPINTKYFQKLGIKYVFFFQDTNPLAFNTLFSLLGKLIHTQSRMCTMAFDRYAGDAVGGLVTLVTKHKKNNPSLNPPQTPNIVNNDVYPDSITANIEYTIFSQLVSNEATLQTEQNFIPGIRVFPNDPTMTKLSPHPSISTNFIPNSQISEFINDVAFLDEDSDEDRTKANCNTCHLSLQKTLSHTTTRYNNQDNILLHSFDSDSPNISIPLLSPNPSQSLNNIPPLSHPIESSQTRPGQSLLPPYQLTAMLSTGSISQLTTNQPCLRPSKIDIGEYPGNSNVFVVDLDDYIEALKGSGGVIGEFINPKIEIKSLKLIKDERQNRETVSNSKPFLDAQEDQKNNDSNVPYFKFQTSARLESLMQDIQLPLQCAVKMTNPLIGDAHCSNNSNNNGCIEDNKINLKNELQNKTYPSHSILHFPSWYSFSPIKTSLDAGMNKILAQNNGESIITCEFATLTFSKRLLLLFKKLRIFNNFQFFQSCSSLQTLNKYYTSVSNDFQCFYNDGSHLKPAIRVPAEQTYDSCGLLTQNPPETPPNPTWKRLLPPIVEPTTPLARHYVEQGPYIILKPTFMISPVVDILSKFPPSNRSTALDPTYAKNYPHNVFNPNLSQYPSKTPNLNLTTNSILIIDGQNIQIDSLYWDGYVYLITIGNNSVTFNTTLPTHFELSPKQPDDITTQLSPNNIDIAPIHLPYNRGIEFIDCDQCPHCQISNPSKNLRNNQQGFVLSQPGANNGQKSTTSMLPELLPLLSPNDLHLSKIESNCRCNQLGIKIRTYTTTQPKSVTSLIKTLVDTIAGNNPYPNVGQQTSNLKKNKALIDSLKYNHKTTNLMDICCDVIIIDTRPKVDHHNDPSHPQTIYISNNNIDNYRYSIPFHLLDDKQ
jgi:hypothetical protein